MILTFRVCQWNHPFFPSLFSDCELGSGLFQMLFGSSPKRGSAVSGTNFRANRKQGCWRPFHMHGNTVRIGCIKSRKASVFWVPTKFYNLRKQAEIGCSHQGLRAGNYHLLSIQYCLSTYKNSSTMTKTLISVLLICWSHDVWYLFMHSYRTQICILKCHT